MGICTFSWSSSGSSPLQRDPPRREADQVSVQGRRPSHLRGRVPTLTGHVPLTSDRRVAQWNVLIVVWRFSSQRKVSLLSFLLGLGGPKYHQT